MKNRKCLECGKSFKPKGNEQICSEECHKKRKYRLNRPAAIAHRERVKAENTLTIICTICGNGFVKTKTRLTCSETCSKIKVRMKNLNCNLEEASDPNFKHTPANKRNPNQEAVAIDNLKLLNTNAPKNDRHILVAKRTHSPNLSKMTVRLYDARLKATYFFTSEASRDRFIERNSAQAEPVSLKKGGRTSVSQY